MYASPEKLAAYEAQKKKAQQLLKVFSKMKDRKNWEDHWEQVLEVVLPNKDQIWTKRSDIAGERKGLKVYDATAVHSCVLLASALQSMLTNPTVQWFGFTTGDRELDKRDDVKKWLQEVARKTHDVINGSNFHTEVHEFYMDLASIGTGGFRTEKDDDTVVRFHADHVSTFWVKESSKGLVDTVARKFDWTLEQILQEWGEDAVEGCQELMGEDRDLTKSYTIIHMVGPRSTYNPQLMLSKDGKPFYSIYILEAKQHILFEGGYNTFPKAVARWAKLSGEEYGRGPGMNALPDIKMIQQMMKTTIRGAQKLVDPPWMFPDDGVVQPLRLAPDSINYARAGTRDSIFPLVAESRIDFGYQVMEDVRTRIRAAFFIDQLQLKDGPQMTATEVQQRTEEQLRLMGPVLGRMHSEFLVPTLDRTFDICWEAGMYPPPPEILRKRLNKGKFGVVFSSQIARAQRASEIGTLDRFLAAMAPIAAAQPGTEQLINAEATARWIADSLGLPHEVLRSELEYKKMQEAQAQAAADAAAKQGQMADAEIVSKVAPAMQKA